MALLITFIALWIAALVFVIYAAIRLLKLARRLENQITDDQEPESTEENIQKEFGADDPMFQSLRKATFDGNNYAEAAKEAEADMNIRMIEQNLSFGINKYDH